MRKLIIGIILLIISIILIFIYWFGNHGRIMFRPNMLEDWTIWGISVACFTTSILFFIKKTKNNQQ